MAPDRGGRIVGAAFTARVDTATGWAKEGDAIFGVRIGRVPERQIMLASRLHVVYPQLGSTQ